MEKLIVETTVNAPIAKVWEYWTMPKHITNWAFAAEDWESPYAENDLRKDGRFKTTMSAKDKSASFDFTGIYAEVNLNKLIEYTIDDGRHVEVEFQEFPESVHIKVSFDPENENPLEMQKNGWQGILDNFKKIY